MAFHCIQTFREGNVIADKLAYLRILSSSHNWHADPPLEILPFLKLDFLACWPLGLSLILDVSFSFYLILLDILFCFASFIAGFSFLSYVPLPPLLKVFSFLRRVKFMSPFFSFILFFLFYKG